jgi:hypothetical protein
MLPMVRVQQERVVYSNNDPFMFVSAPANIYMVITVACALYHANSRVTKHATLDVN